jgi:hypothetical protein
MRPQPVTGDYESATNRQEFDPKRTYIRNGKKQNVYRERGRVNENPKDRVYHYKQSIATSGWLHMTCTASKGNKKVQVHSMVEKKHFRNNADVSDAYYRAKHQCYKAAVVKLTHTNDYKQDINLHVDEWYFDTRRIYHKRR